MSLSALYVLEKATDDLHNFKEFSKIFEKNKQLTRNENRLMESAVYFRK